LTQNCQIRRGNTYGEGLVSKWSATLPSLMGGVETLPNFGGSFQFMRTPFDTELPNFTW